MADPGKTIGAVIRYEMMLQSGPLRFSLQGVEFDIPAGSDLPVIVRQVFDGRRLVEEKIVGVVGNEHRQDSREFMNLRSFLNRGGAIGLEETLRD